MDASTGNERRPTIAREYAGTCSRCDEAIHWYNTVYPQYGGDKNIRQNDVNVIACLYVTYVY